MMCWCALRESFWRHLVNYQQSWCLVQNNSLRECHKQYNWYCCTVCESCCQRAVSRILAQPTEHSKKSTIPLILTAEPALETTLVNPTYQDCGNFIAILKYLHEMENLMDMLCFFLLLWWRLKTFDAYHERMNPWDGQFDGKNPLGPHREDLPQQVLLPEDCSLQSKRARWSVQRKEGRRHCLQGSVRWHLYKINGLACLMMLASHSIVLYFMLMFKGFRSIKVGHAQELVYILFENTYQYIRIVRSIVYIFLYILYIYIYTYISVEIRRYTNRSQRRRKDSRSKRISSFLTPSGRFASDPHSTFWQLGVTTLQRVRWLVRKIATWSNLR